MLPSPKLLVLAVAGAAALLRLSFGVLSPREKPVPPEAGAVLPKLKPAVWVVGAGVLSEKRPVDGADAAGWEGFPKLNPPLPVPLPLPLAEKEKPVEGAVLAGFAAPKVKPPAGAPEPPNVKPLMAAADPSPRRHWGGFAPALSAPTVSQPRPPPLLPAAME